MGGGGEGEGILKARNKPELSIKCMYIFLHRALYKGSPRPEHGHAYGLASSLGRVAFILRGRPRVLLSPC